MKKSLYISLILLMVLPLVAHAISFSGGGSGGGVTDHGALTGLDDPDHDAVYFQENEHVSFTTGIADAFKPIVLDAAGLIDGSMLSAGVSAHQLTHNEAGTDELKLDDLGIPDDNVDLNASTLQHGLLPKLSGTATEYLNGTGAWSTPPDTFLTVYIDGIAESALAPTLNFNSSFFTLTEAPADTFAIVIADDAVTYAKMQNVIADNVFLGNNSGIGAVVDELTGTEATAMLDLFTDTLKGLAPAYPNNTTDFLRGDGTWATPPDTVYNSPLTTKGDVFTYDTGDQRLAVGTDGQVLTADSAEATGLKWAAPSTGSSSAIVRFDLNGPFNTTFERIGGVHICNATVTYTAARSFVYYNGTAGNLTAQIWLNNATTGVNGDITIPFSVTPSVANEVISVTCNAGDYIWVDITGLPTGNSEDFSVVLYELI